MSFIYFYYLYFNFNLNTNETSELLLRSVGIARGSWDTGLLYPIHLLLPYNGGAQSVMGNLLAANNDDWGRLLIMERGNKECHGAIIP